MKSIKFLASCSFIALLSSSAIAEERIDRSQRANPYPNTPSYAQGGDTSRYDTSNGWSRGGRSWYWGNGGSDIPTSGYTAPVPPRYGNRRHHEGRCGGGQVIVVNNHPQIAQNTVRPPQNNSNKPNCQRGTTFDGHGCKIIDRRLNQPGGDGYINPCRNGAWYSNGRCVRN